MKIAVLGTGVVGQTIASKLAELGHEVWLGSRSSSNETAVAWAARAGGKARAATFADAVRGSDLVFNCTLGSASVDALRAAGAGNLDDKVVIDVSNPLDFGTKPASLTVANTDSLAETLQREFPTARIVKALNTMKAAVMVEPRQLPATHTVFVCGNDARAKSQTRDVLKSFGWLDEEILDLGDLTAARGCEAYVLLWVQLRLATGTGMFNVHVVRAG